MKTNVELDDVLVEKAMKLTRISTKEDLINKALEELIKSNIRKEMLRCKNSDIWEGDINEMRAINNVKMHSNVYNDGKITIRQRHA